MRHRRCSIALARLAVAAALLLLGRPPAGAQQVQMMSPDVFVDSVPAVVQPDCLIVPTTWSTCAGVAVPMPALAGHFASWEVRYADL